MPPAKHVTIDRTHLGDHVSLVLLNRPERKNALSIALRRDLAAAVQAIAADSRSRVTVLAAVGDVFSAGFDLSEFNGHDEQAIWSSADELHRAVLCHPVPVIAALDGPAYAGGADLAVLADLRVGTTQTVLVHPERQRYPVMLGPLADLVGRARAFELALTGRAVGAEEALRIGLLNELVHPDTPVAARVRALDLAANIAETPRDLLAAMKSKIVRTRGFDVSLTTLDL